MNKGAKRLADKPGTQAEKAEKLGVKQQTVSSWLADGVIPQGKQLIKIEQEYGIPVADWLEDEATSATAAP